MRILLRWCSVPVLLGVVSPLLLPTTKTTVTAFTASSSASSALGSAAVSTPSPPSSSLTTSALPHPRSHGCTSGTIRSPTNTKFPVPISLHSSPLDDPDDLINFDSDDEEASGAAVVKEPFTSELDEAQRANALLLADDDGENNSQNSSIELQQELESSFLQYAMSIILGRALPDGRDGLKPVHRRILYAMYQLKLVPTTSHRKCARVVGEVLGKYHPHGDMSVYDALVRMAQDFSTLYRLVDGHGNFGSIDNDPAAAMRYTECKLTAIAVETLLQDLEYATVDYIPNFDGNEDEPTVLPSKLPLLLLNGSSGIAVGMATNIPPHNLREVVTACRAFITHERMTTNTRRRVTDTELFTMIPAPDFPTGATILDGGGTGAEHNDIHKMYLTGNGRVTMRSVTHLEQLGGSGNNKKGRTAIIVTELPYQVNKAALLEQLANLVNEKKLEGISDLRDESDRDGIRVVLELKQRDANPQVILANLYKKTKLQTVFSGNLLALMTPGSVSAGGGSETTGHTDTAEQENPQQRTITTTISEASTESLTPQRFTLRESLNYFLDFRFQTIRRKTQYQLHKVDARIHIVEGLLVALQRIDDVIELIKKMPDPASCRMALMRTGIAGSDDPETIAVMQGIDLDGIEDLCLGLSRIQADSVLKLQLSQLTRLNQGNLHQEKQDLVAQQATFQQILEVDDAVYTIMLEEMNEMNKKYGHDRKSKIIYDDDGAVQELDMVRNSRSVIIVTRGGYIKRMELKTFESQNRGTRGKKGAGGAGEDEDEILHCITCKDRDTLLMIGQNGIAYGLHAYQVPSGSRTAKGTPLPSVLPISVGQVITAVLPVQSFTQNDEQDYVVLATLKGLIKKTPLKAFEKTSNRGLTIASLADGDKLLWCHKCNDDDDILIGTSRGMAARLAAVKLRPTGRTSKGVKAMRLREGDTIADMNVLSSNRNDNKEFVLCITKQGYGKRVATNDFRTTSRGAVGVIAIKFKSSPETTTTTMTKTGNGNGNGSEEDDDEPDAQDKVSCFCIVHEDDEILLGTSQGLIVRQQAKQIPCQGRTATGVRVQKLKKDSFDHITSVSIVPRRGVLTTTSSSSSSSATE